MNDLRYGSVVCMNEIKPKFPPKYSKPRVMHSGLTGKDYEVPAGMII